MKENNKELDKNISMRMDLERQLESNKAVNPQLFVSLYRKINQELYTQLNRGLYDELYEELEQKMIS